MTNGEALDLLNECLPDGFQYTIHGGWLWVAGQRTYGIQIVDPNGQRSQPISTYFAKFPDAVAAALTNLGKDAVAIATYPRHTEEIDVH